uniref:Uncharacterized protein n=1 Tax=Ditylum brightwellii TaxID=49249 RepID=A0A7S2ED53_9STRA|mmetsp:Transcript_25097/g.37454  ORF Transcript_25097/g.37454 Transcript_25097/m.37454 type:complete len:118 (+) Transcript_25097:493-846(+)
MSDLMNRLKRHHDDSNKCCHSRTCHRRHLKQKNHEKDPCSLQTETMNMKDDFDGNDSNLAFQTKHNNNKTTVTKKDDNPKPKCTNLICQDTIILRHGHTTPDAFSLVQLLDFSAVFL